MVCEDHAYSYKFKLNAHRDYDLGHGTNASGRGALKAEGLWRHETLMASVQNIMYGSQMSPPRMEQIKDTVAEYFSYADETDEWFQLHLPNIIEQLFPDKAITDPGVDKDIFSV